MVDLRASPVNVRSSHAVSRRGPLPRNPGHAPRGRDAGRRLALARLLAADRVPRSGDALSDAGGEARLLRRALAVDPPLAAVLPLPLRLLPPPARAPPAR